MNNHGSQKFGKCILLQYFTLRCKYLHCKIEIFCKVLQINAGNIFQMTPLNDRLKALLDEKSVSMSDLSKMLNASERSIYNYINGKSSPSVEMVGIILKKFSGLSARWLLTGEGEMWDKKGAAVHQVAGPVNGNGNKVNVAVLTGEVEALKKEVELLRQVVKDKEEIIDLLRAQLKS